MDCYLQKIILLTFALLHPLASHHQNVFTAALPLSAVNYSWCECEVLGVKNDFPKINAKLLKSGQLLRIVLLSREAFASIVSHRDWQIGQLFL